MDLVPHGIGRRVWVALERAVRAFVRLGQIADGVNLGQNLEEAIADAAKLLDTPELKFFAVSLSVQRETGGNLAETLANLADILRRRRQMKLKVKAMSSEARASAYILGSA